MFARLRFKAVGNSASTAFVMVGALGLTAASGAWTPLAISQTEINAPQQITSDTPLVHDATAGTVAGEGSTEAGAASYRIPISVPPGRAGLEPSVALTYSSRGGNGIAGVGWSLSASSAVQRCPQTLEQDGRTRGVRFDVDDRLCLDGQRLLRVAGSGYGQSGAEYRTEIDSFARITQVGGGLTGSATCFKVEQKSGRVLHYGAVNAAGVCLGSARSARVQPAGAAATLSWLIEKEEDRVGNNVFYSYANYGNGEVLPSQIDYTGFGISAGDRSVRMVYANRLASDIASVYDADIASSYLAGGATLQTQRLQRIDTYESATSKVASWKLDYGLTSRSTGRSVLRAVNQCATVAGVETCFSVPTQFDWDDLAPQYRFQSLTLPNLPQSSWALSDAWLAQEVLKEMQDEQLGELNGARSDPLAGGYTVADLPVPNVVGTPLGAVLAFSTVADFDGDGARESLARVQSSTGPKTYLVQLMPDRSVRSAVDVSAQLNVFADSNSFEVSDIDGDGRADLLSNTNPLSFLVWNAAAGAAPTTPAFRVVTTSIPAGVPTSTFRARLADFNGDGRPDLLTVAAHSTCGIQYGVFIHLNNLPTGVVGSTAAFTESTTPLFCLSRASTGDIGESIDRIADFDGDGLPDLFINNSSGGLNTFSRIVLMQTSGVSLDGPITRTASAIGLTTDEQSRAANRVAHWMDINGDGLDDFVFAQSQGGLIPTGQWTVRLNRGGILSASISTGSGVGLTTTNTSNSSCRVPDDCLVVRSHGLYQARGVLASLRTHVMTEMTR